MPTLVTRKQYACSHSLDTRHRSLGTDDGVEIDTVPIPSACPGCMYESLLEGCRELAEDNEHDFSTLDQTTFTDEAARVAEFAKYLQDLVEKKRCALLAFYGAGYVPEF